MARKTALDELWDDLPRVSLAWNGIRLNPEYRQDWQTAKPYFEYARRFGETNQHKFRKTPTWRWLSAIGYKWFRDAEQALVDPDLEIPFKKRSLFRRCFRECLKPWTSPVNPAGFTPRIELYQVDCAHPTARGVECWKRYEEIMRQCPVKARSAGGVYLRDPFEPSGKDDTAEHQAWASTPAGAFDVEARKDPDKLVLWLDRSFPRLVLRDGVERCMGDCSSERERGGKPVWDQRSRRVGFVKCHASDDMMAISIDMRGPRLRVSREMDYALDKLARSPFKARWLDLEKGFDLYRRIKPRGKETLQGICEKKFGKRAWIETANSWSSEGMFRHSGIRKMQYALKRATEFIEGKEYMRFISTGREIPGPPPGAPPAIPGCPR